MEFTQSLNTWHYNHQPTNHMKLTLEQHGTTVTIETKDDGQTTYEMAQYFRDLLLGQCYHWDSVQEALPHEEDIEKLIEEALAEKVFDSEEILVHPTS